MVNKIRFKNDYEKLPEVWDGTYAKLICCYPETLDNLEKGMTAFFRKDTKIRHKFPRNHIEQYYPVSHKDLLILIFIHLNTGNLFSTLRHNTEENFEKYVNTVGENYKLEHS